MSKFFIGFLSASQLAAVHAAGHAIESFALSEPQKLVATLKSTSIGATVTADINALKDSSLSGLEKFEKVVATTAPLIASYVASGPAGIVADAGDIARELVQSLYNDVVSAIHKASAPAPSGDSGVSTAPTA